MLIANLILAATSSFAAPESITIESVVLTETIAVELGEDGRKRRRGRGRARNFLKRIGKGKGGSKCPKPPKCKPGKGKKNCNRPVPEPMTLSLLGLGGAGLIGTLRRRRQNATDAIESVDA